MCVRVCVRVASMTGGNAYWAALPTGGWHRQAVGRNCNVREALNGWQCNRGTCRVMTRVGVEEVKKYHEAAT